ncbi:hypothetical protein BgiBS90_012986, partial [Biomphalaria glabrata]
MLTLTYFVVPRANSRAFHVAQLFGRSSIPEYKHTQISRHRCSDLPSHPQGHMHSRSNPRWHEPSAGGASTNDSPDGVQQVNGQTVTPGSTCSLKVSCV